MVPSRLMRWAATIGPQTAALVRRSSPRAAIRARLSLVLGILRLAKRYDAPRLEAACARALTAGARSYRHVAAILQRGLDRTTPAPTTDPVPAHENIRGRDYYH